MENLNVVSTPNITGNVGSCSTQVVTQASERSSFFIQTYHDIATNSCTGEQSISTYWSYSGEVSFTFGVFVIAIFVVLIRFVFRWLFD